MMQGRAIGKDSSSSNDFGGKEVLKTSTTLSSKQYRNIVAEYERENSRERDSEQVR